MGVWIETFARIAKTSGSAKSHPVWVCGLKLTLKLRWNRRERHTLYGCVD